ncbi:hypothetical protein KPATCC21470_1478 [Kitasatospora purpeofusca]
MEGRSAMTRQPHHSLPEDEPHRSARPTGSSVDRSRAGGADR